MKDTLANIALFLPTLKREIDAFEETRTKHDRQRVGRALWHLQDQIDDLRKELSNVTIVDAGDINDEAKTRE